MGVIVKILQDERKLNRSELFILDAALHSFLKFIYHGTTIKKIADLAGACKAAVNYYFRSKMNLKNHNNVRY